MPLASHFGCWYTTIDQEPAVHRKILASRGRFLPQCLQLVHCTAARFDGEWIHWGTSVYLEKRGAEGDGTGDARLLGDKSSDLSLRGM